MFFFAWAWEVMAVHTSSHKQISIQFWWYGTDVG